MIRHVLPLLAGSLLILAAAQAAVAEQLTGKVVRVVDGDTIVLEAKGDRDRIRLAGIDAPERNQPWGKASTRELRREIAGETAMVDWHKKDRWKRLIGVVRHEGRDMNLHMVDRGLAWYYKKYQAEQAPKQRETYSAAEIEAREERRGIGTVQTGGFSDCTKFQP